MAGLDKLLTGRSGKFDQIKTMALPLPMVLHTNRQVSGFTHTFIFLLFLGFTVVSGLMIFVQLISGGSLLGVLFWISVPLVIAFVGLSNWRFSRPGAAYLKLDQEGFTEHIFSESKRVRWDSVEYFKVVRLLKADVTIVGWRYKAYGQHQTRRRSSRFSKHYTLDRWAQKYVDDVFSTVNYGDMYLYPHDFEQLMNELRDRHGS